MNSKEENKGGALAVVDVLYVDGRKEQIRIGFPRSFDSAQWIGINECECGAGIKYSWNETGSLRTCGDLPSLQNGLYHQKRPLRAQHYHASRAVICQEEDADAENCSRCSYWNHFLGSDLLSI